MQLAHDDGRRCRCQKKARIIAKTVSRSTAPSRVTSMRGTRCSTRPARLSGLPSTCYERETMRKFVTIMMAALFAAATVNAVAQDKKKDEPKKEAGKKDDKKSK